MRFQIAGPNPRPSFPSSADARARSELGRRIGAALEVRAASRAVGNRRMSCPNCQERGWYNGRRCLYCAHPDTPRAMAYERAADERPQAADFGGLEHRIGRITGMR